MRGKITLTVAAMVAGLTAVGRGNILTNGDLETGLPITMPDNLVYASPTLNSNALPGWTITSGTIDVVPNSYFQSSTGNFSVDMIGTPGIGSIQQAVTTVSGDAYGLTFDFSINPENSSGEAGSTKFLQVEALGTDGSTVLASQIYSGTAGARTDSNMGYFQQTFQFVSDGTAATIVFSALTPTNLPAGVTGATAYCGPVIDNADLEDLGAVEPPTPEPASLAMVGMGSLMLLRRRRV